MKALIKSGVCLALGWLANGAAAQDVTIKWQASKSDGSRPVTLSQPQPLDGTGQIRPVSGQFAPIVRMQAPDEKIAPPIPTLELGGVPKDVNGAKKLPKDKDFVPPPPQTTPTPVYSSLMPNDCSPEPCGGADGCGRGWFRPNWLRGCPDGPRFYGAAEALVWWQRGQVVTPLITANPVGTPTSQTGILGGSAVLYDQVPNQTLLGGRFTLGTWFPHWCCNLGLETTFFFLPRTASSATFSSLGDPQLSRPFTDTVAGPNAEPFAINNGTDKATGSATIHTFSELWGIEANLRYKWFRGQNCYVDLLFGYRYLNLSEGIDLTEDRQNTMVGGMPNTIHTFEQESFHTRNQFNGLQVGLDTGCRIGQRWFFGVTGKVAFGTVNQLVNINGSTTFSNVPPPFVNGTVPGALLASTTNIGQFTQNKFGVLPSVGFKVGYDITPNLMAFAGYDFIYLSSVVRPAAQIDPRINQSFRPLPAPFVATGTGPALPGVLMRTSDYWAQGMSFGLLYRY